MKTKGTSLREVSMMHYAADEEKVMSELNAKWALTMDLNHENMLLYPIDIMVEKVEEIYPRKFVDKEDFFEYKAENGSKWLISNSLTVEDIDKFFRNYLHLNEEGIIAA